LLDEIVAASTKKIDDEEKKEKKRLQKKRKDTTEQQKNSERKREKLDEEAAVLRRVVSAIRTLIAKGRKLGPATASDIAETKAATDEIIDLFENNRDPLEEGDVTPYIHMFCHFEELLQREPRRSLGFYSQEAVEQCNFLVKNAAQCSNHGGGKEGATNFSEQILFR